MSSQTPIIAKLSLVSKAEVQSLVACILGGRQIIGLLLIGHGIPDLIPLLVPPHIIVFGSTIQHNVEKRDCNEHAVTSSIFRSVVSAVNV